MTENRIITQICIVVHDVKKVNANWAKVLGLPEEKIETIFPDGILHYTHDQAVDYKGIQVAKYEFENFVLELLQPGEAPSPWKTHLGKYGQGVFHFCVLVDDRKVFQQRLTDIGVGLPYHIGYFLQGSYSYVAAKEQRGIELSVNNNGDYSELFQVLLNGAARPLDELKLNPVIVRQLYCRSNLYLKSGRLLTPIEAHVTSFAMTVENRKLNLWISKLSANGTPRATHIVFSKQWTSTRASARYSKNLTMLSKRLTGRRMASIWFTTARARCTSTNW
jgi:catechol 2,3-dioxygenase-like lactoylglutathione lyase family enzyme